MQEIRYVITDLDDTLLSPDEQITPRTREAIAALAEAGIGLMMASGRMIASMAPYARELSMVYPFIACNGAQIADAKTMAPVYEDLMPLALAKELCLLLEELGCYFQVYNGNLFYYAEENDRTREYSRSSGSSGKEVGLLSAFVDRPTPKLLVIEEVHKASQVRQLLQERYAGVLAVTQSKDYYVEITAATATKGAALAHLLAMLGIPKEQVLAIGDGRNDVEMFQAAGISVAMGSALPEVAAAADFQTLPNSQDGWAHFMFETLLASRAGGGAV